MAATATSGSDKKSDKKKAEAPKPPKEYNPRWKGYVFIILTSLVCFASISNIDKAERKAEWALGISFGIITFAVSVLIMVFDRWQCIESFNYTKAYDGKLEGSTLLFFVLLWTAGVAILTKGSGLAYYATNIYFSSWAALASCVYTLDKWSAAKDILSIREMTQLSATLKSWYALLLCSIVVFGSGIDLLHSLHQPVTRNAAFAIALGLISSIVSTSFILVHYKFFKGIKQGGWLELTAAFFMILGWTIGVAILTQDGGIAATLTGTTGRPTAFPDASNCTVVVENYDPGTNATTTEYLECSSLYEDEIPGSNLYLFSWGALLASVNITLRWKAAQALQFAHAAHNHNASDPTQRADGANGDNNERDEDDDDAI